jgi:hypothetical protein
VSKLISDILGAKQPEFSQQISDWERMIGNPGIDIRLSTSLRELAKKQIAKLGLDAEDTSQRELYHALTRRLLADNERLAKKLEVDANLPPNELSAKIVKFVKDKVDMPQTWQIKSSRIKKLLKANPPKALMKATGYRSVDSLTKREKIAEVIALGRALDPSWHKRLCDSYRKISPSDIEQKKTQILTPSASRLARIEKKAKLPKGQIATVNELGTVVLFPSKLRFQADVIANAAILIEALREIKLAGALLKLLSVRKDFGKQASRLLESGSHSSAKYLPVRWSSICHYAYKNRLTPEFTQPHISQEDIDVMPSATQFAIAWPELNYWYGTDYLGIADGDGPVSFSLIDVVLNTSNNLPFEDRSADYLRNALWDELHSRYLKYPEIQSEIFKAGF